MNTTRMPASTPSEPQARLLYHFCRMQLPAIPLSSADFERHLRRTFELYRSKGHDDTTWEAYLENLYPLDWFVAMACLQNEGEAWEVLYASRTGRADCLLVDALRARAARLFPRNEGEQAEAVDEFWGSLLLGTGKPNSVPILARYDGQRPLVPWLIRVFHNRQISRLRHGPGPDSLVEDPPDLLPPEASPSADGRWHEAFSLAAREWLGGLNENEVLLLGLRMRYRMSQREVASYLGVHEGTVSRRADDVCLGLREFVGRRLQARGWTGDDLSGYIQSEMGNLLYDEPRLSANHLAGLLAARGKQLPSEPGPA